MIAVLRLTLLFVLLFALPANAADSYDRAVVDYDQGRFSDALASFTRLAERGHAGAEFMLGAMYFHGKGVPKNDKFAAIWFQKAAVKGDPNGQLAFGSLYIRGVGVQQDLIRAYAWLSIAANANVSGLRQQAISLRDEAARLMQPDEIQRARRIADAYEPRKPGLTH